MRIDIVTVLPGLLTGPFDESIVKRGIDKGLVEVHVHNLRDWSTNKHNKVDDAPFGTAAGMVLAMQPLHDAITDLQSQREYDEVIFLTPDGETLAQPRVNQLSLSGNLMLICGHYKGIDQRLRDHVITLELSIGDYVLSGGELAAAVLTDALVRLVPGVIGDETSALSDSFQDGSVGSAGVHQACGVQRLEGARRAAQREPRRHRRVARSASVGPDQSPPSRPVGRKGWVTWRPFARIPSQRQVDNWPLFLGERAADSRNFRNIAPRNGQTSLEEPSFTKQPAYHGPHQRHHRQVGRNQGLA